MADKKYKHTDCKYYTYHHYLGTYCTNKKNHDGYTVPCGFDEDGPHCRFFEKKGCYIATAVYGDYNAPQVLVLRKFRDERLCKSRFGRVFIKIYYSISPTLAERLKKTKRINNAVRKILDKIVEWLQ